MHRQKYQALKNKLQNLPGLMVAFSGGVDSTLLLQAAIEAVGKKNVLAVTFHSTIYDQHELPAIRNLVSAFNCRFTIIEDNSMLELADFRANPPNRCYICKRYLFGRLLETAQREHLPAVADGANADDVHDYRPGMQAAGELNVLSPLQEAGLTKREIRLLAREMGLATWNKPSSPCLCSRIPYGCEITEKKLRQIENGENFLKEMGFPEVRLRHHENLARIEVPAERIADILNDHVLPLVKNRFRDLGFQYVTVDLHGFRSGSLNETLTGSDLDI